MCVWLWAAQGMLCTHVVLVQYSSDHFLSTPLTDHRCNLPHFKRCAHCSDAVAEALPSIPRGRLRGDTCPAHSSGGHLFPLLTCSHWMPSKTEGGGGGTVPVSADLTCSLIWICSTLHPAPFRSDQRSFFFCVCVQTTSVHSYVFGYTAAIV